ncbi:unnamed protein product [Brachionus calyciflorus]|uniref:Uncharacterized protein n=1 Tax=Brachionus calyciflorus TaxID=104777 RepID=A0A813M1Q0_9BILA|nr:unnamed protein product [Brachionus calyciflorus]
MNPKFNWKRAFEIIVYKGKVYDIDGGYYDAVKLNKLLAITKKFIELKPLAIKVRLASINYDLKNQWSNEAREFFLQKADKSKFFKSSVRKFNIESNVYEIELSEISIGSVNQLMINAGLAMKGTF